MKWLVIFSSDSFTMENTSISCTVSVEELTPAGNILKKTHHHSLTLTIGRDEFKEMQLKVDFC